MATKKATKTARKSKSWKDIDQDVRAKGMSSTAFKRMIFARCRKSVIVIVAIVVVAGGAKLFLETEDVSNALTKAGRALPLKTVETESDVLSREWILYHLDLNRDGLNLLTLDLGEMKRSLESYTQIRKAELVRQLPDTLFVSIEEREPIAKIIASDVGRGRITLLADDEGVIYEGIGYDPKQVLSLPSLDGIRLKRKDGGFKSIAGMDILEELLSEARTLAPHLYSSWKVVSFEAWPNIVVKSDFAREAVFEPNPNGYRRQLAELDYIIDYNKSRSVNKVVRVDLTLNSQVPVTRASFVQ